jgi:hypothetical protein
MAHRRGKKELRAIHAKSNSPWWKNLKVKKGKMTQFGYNTADNEFKRHNALIKAVRKDGADTVFKRLNLQVVFRKNKEGKDKDVFVEDRDWVKRVFVGRERD